MKTKIKKLELPWTPQRINNPRKRRYVFQRCQNWINIQQPRPEASANYQFVTTTFFG